MVMNAKPSQSITVRRESFCFDALPLYYYDNNPFISHLLTALSLTFPNGERFFVHAVRNVRDQVSNPTLQREVSAFIGQEAMHSHAHEDFNNFAIRMGLDVQPVIDFEHQKIEKLKASLGKKQQLAITCALEHFTAIIAQFLLENTEFQQGFHPEAARLWMWHALEETEHKSVAFDVYQAVFADDVIRKRMMRVVTATFLSRITQLTLKLLLKDPVGRKQWRQNLAGARKIGQLMQALVPAYLDYYQQGFHPTQHDTTRLSADWAARLSAA
jgi:predicted metal-dependent hydrolase